MSFFSGNVGGVFGCSFCSGLQYINCIDRDLTSRSHRSISWNNKCLIISETIQALPIKYAVNTVRLMVYMTIASTTTWTLYSRSQVRLKLDYFLTCNISDHSDLAWLMDAIWYSLLILVSMILTLMQCHSGLSKAKSQCCMPTANKQAISIELATTVGHFLRDLYFANVYMAWQTCGGQVCRSKLILSDIVSGAGAVDGKQPRRRAADWKQSVCQ